MSRLMLTTRRFEKIVVKIDGKEVVFRAFYKSHTKGYWKRLGSMCRVIVEAPKDARIERQRDDLFPYIWNGEKNARDKQTSDD